MEKNRGFGRKNNYREDRGYYLPNAYDDYQNNYHMQQKRLQQEQQMMNLRQQQLKQQKELQLKQQQIQRQREMLRRQQGNQLMLPQKSSNSYYDSGYNNNQYQEYSNYNMNDMGYYGYYDNNSYIVEGNDYLRNNYIENEYSYNNGYYGNYYNNYPQEGYGYYNGNDRDNGYVGYSKYSGYGTYDNNTYYGNANMSTNTYVDDLLNQRTKVHKPAVVSFDKNDEELYTIDSDYLEDDEETISIKDVLNLILCVGLALMIAFLVVTYVGQRTDVDGHSMNFNLKNEDVLIINKLSYRFEKPKRYDIVTFPVDDKTYYIKRVIGLPGEKVKVTSKDESELEPNRIYINGKPLDEDYGFSAFINNGIEINPEELNDNGEYEVKENEYFVMGDNRNDSKDSRVIGAIKEDKIVGKAVFRLYPFDTIGSVTDTTINKKIKLNNEYSLGKDGKTKVQKDEEEEYKKNIKNKSQEDTKKEESQNDNSDNKE